MKTIAKVAAFLLITAACVAQAPAPKDGYVPDEKTAVKIAEAVLSPICGEQKIEGERPFHAKLEGNVWAVSGSLPPHYVGGVAVIHIDKQTGAIISHIHYK
jgi:hypothetical protein